MNTLLSHLADELNAIRCSHPTEPLRLSPLPELNELTSVPAEIIQIHLGQPCDLKRMNLDPDTMVYLFHKLPAGWRGGGPELHIQLDSDRCCESANWKFSR